MPYKYYQASQIFAGKATSPPKGAPLQQAPASLKNNILAPKITGSNTLAYCQDQKLKKVITLKPEGWAPTSFGPSKNINLPDPQ